MGKINLTIDNQEITVDTGTSVLNACKQAGIQVPVFCYHERLSVAGNCRMCLVEQEKSPKPIASCATPVAEGMIIHTNTPSVKKAREGALEFLLINHPLDCPICDQGGECDLQNITQAHARQHSRFQEPKRAVEDKDFGPIVKTVMTRCIHCTRCVRFATEIAGVPEIGSLGRGENMEISTYLAQAMTSELSGNIIDLCPVGALTLKPYEFKARMWELKSTEAIDVTDAMGTHIYIDSREDEILRIRPRECPSINEEWITDKTRMLFEGLKIQRLDRPYIRRNGKLQAAEWVDALELIASKFKSSNPQKMAGLVGPLCEAESMFALKELFKSYNIPSLDCRLGFEKIDSSLKDHYTFQTKYEELENLDLCLLIGTNLRLEAPLVNLRLRKGVIKNNLQVFSIGDPHDLTYNYKDLGHKPKALEDILNGKIDLSQFSNKAVILGSELLKREDIHSIVKKLSKLFEINILHKEASKVAALKLDILPEPKGLSTFEIIQAANNGHIDFLYLLGVDIPILSPTDKTFTVYQGHHGEHGAEIADVVLPGLSFIEKSGTYINLEGTIQTMNSAVHGPGCAKEDWKIIRALSGVLGNPLPFNHIDELRTLMLQSLEAHASKNVTPLEESTLLAEDIHSAKGNFYTIDVISRHSSTLKKRAGEQA